MSWNHLPSELRQQIIGHLAEGCVAPREAAAPFAAVSREWQGIVEEILFRDISLVVNDHVDLNKFARFTSDVRTYRRHYIRNISVILTLPRYNCDDARQPENAVQIQQNNKVFTELMQAFLGILSDWTTNQHPRPLTLDLNIKSYSDLAHSFRDIHMNSYHPLRYWNFRSPCHEWCRDNFYNCCLPPGGLRALERYLGSLLTFTDVRLPRVPVVTSFMQRLQFKRQLSPSALGKLMQESLVGLSSLRLERWCRPTEGGERKYISDFKKDFLPLLPEGLKVFQYYAERPTYMNGSAKGTVKPLSLFEILSTQGRGLRQISIVEPYDSAITIKEMKSMVATSLSRPLMTIGWDMLENVCFGSPLLDSYDPRRGPNVAIDELLKLSASMAEQMRGLRSWEIFGNKGLQPRSREDHIFRFSMEPSLSAASMSWLWWLPGLRYAWRDFSFSPDVRSAWDKVAIMRTGKSVNCLLHENNIFSQLGRSGFELTPVHPFTTYLAGRGKDQLLMKNHDDNVVFYWP